MQSTVVYDLCLSFLNAQVRAEDIQSQQLRAVREEESWAREWGMHLSRLGE